LNDAGAFSFLSCSWRGERSVCHRHPVAGAVNVPSVIGIPVIGIPVIGIQPEVGQPESTVF
jgi:hypothetical protein